MRRQLRRGDYVGESVHGPHQFEDTHCRTMDEFELFDVVGVKKAPIYDDHGCVLHHLEFIVDDLQDPGTAAFALVILYSHGRWGVENWFDFLTDGDQWWSLEKDETIRPSILHGMLIKAKLGEAFEHKMVRNG